MKHALIAAAVLAAFTAGAEAAGKHGVTFDAFAPLSTPPGITLQPLGKFQGYGVDQETAALIGHGQIAFADARGMTLYTYDDDAPGKIACVDDCTKTWPPLLAEAADKGFGAWSIVVRPDGGTQWALRGKPLYRYVKDEDPGSVGGNSPKRFGRGPNISERGEQLTEIAEDVPLPQGWHPAMHYPAPLDGLPPDFTIREVEDAAGLVLVNSANWTLYAFAGDLNADQKACGSPCPFKPVIAGMLAGAKGDFLPVSRDDGVRQWTYKGLGLYTFVGDLARGDANGVGVNKNWRVAHVARDYMPEGVSVQESERLGKILADARGRTLYRRDAYLFQSGSGHGQRRGVLMRPVVGRDLATDPHCMDACDKWHPFFAPASAEPQGYWSIYTRADGRRQWAYQGYALWIYDGDTKPGDINGNDAWDIARSNNLRAQFDIGTHIDTVPALYWAATAP
jgi:predicted lipoprotein with Yx(FWY)xxD motif